MNMTLFRYQFIAKALRPHSHTHSIQNAVHSQYCFSQMQMKRPSSMAQKLKELVSSLEASKDLVAKLDELTKMELNQKENMKDLNNREISLKNNEAKLAADQDRTFSKQTELYKYEHVLKLKEKDMIQREQECASKSIETESKQKELAKLEVDLKRNEEYFNQKVKELEQERAKFNEQKHNFEIDRKRLDQQIEMHKTEMAEVDKQRKVLQYLCKQG